MLFRSEELQEAYEVAVEVPFGDDHEDLLKCLRRVIQYYSTHEQFEEWLMERGI